jgi:hypothetical protein
MMLLAAGVLTACQASSTFTPVAPDVVVTRLTAALDNPFVVGAPIASGRTGQYFGGTTIYLEEEGLYSYTLVLDWSSPTNRVTIAVHRTGGAVSFDNENEVGEATCSVPGILTGPPFPNTGIPIGAPLPLPLCPVVWSNTTNEKPKVLQLTNATSGRYAIVVTNEGPGTETVRAVFLAE